MYRVNRTGNGAHYSNSFNTYEEALDFYNKVKGAFKNCELATPDGIEKSAEKRYIHGEGYVIFEK